MRASAGSTDSFRRSSGLSVGSGTISAVTPGRPSSASTQQSRALRLARADALMVARLPGLERRERADDAFLADLHAAADAAVLQVDVADESPSVRRRCRRSGRPGTCGRNKGRDRRRRRGTRQVVLGCSIDDDRHAAFMGDFREYFQRKLRVVDHVMRDDIDGGCGALGDRAVATGRPRRWSPGRPARPWRR